jgi:hypothetical protein
VIVAALLTPLSGTAQTSSNQRFGLVNAFQDSDAARISGAGWEIVTLHWNELQPNSPTDWNPNPEVDDWLESARTDEREVIVVVIGAPAWATSGQAVTGVPRGLYLPISDPGNGWAGFMSHAASYYGSRGINRWVIWRNPDIPSGAREATWDGSIEEYYQLVKVAYLSARNANPNALIHLAGVGYDPNWFNRFADILNDDPTAPANDYYFDVATLHVYDSPERVYTLMRNHFFVMDQQGIPLKEVWINETNARPAVDPQVYPPDASFREHPNTTLEQQAAFMVQSYALAFAANRGARVAVYRLVDDLATDDDQAFGLVRDDGTPRPAYAAYQLIAQEFNGFVYARRVEEGTHPLVDYVRLTFANQVTHVVWALTEQNATLVIPSRSSQATLIDLGGNRWTVMPESGAYRVTVGAADCNDPATGCLIGGAPWLLVEEGVPDAVNAEPPPVTSEPGGTLPTPDPGLAMTSTAQAVPTLTPTPLPTATSEPTEPPTQPPAQEPPAEPTEPATEVAEVGEPQQATPMSTPDPASLQAANFRPGGIAGLLPFALIGVGLLVVGGGAWFFLSSQRPPVESEEPHRRTREHEPPRFENLENSDTDSALGGK